jgi:rubrerythrin
MNRIVLAGVVAVASVVAAATAGGSAARAATGTTLENLQTAYDAESNATVRYKAFAEKADAEGYHRVARLFRAASRAEAIHAENHAAAIRALGGTPRAVVAVPEVRSTKQNLRAALAGERRERDTVYPEFIARAKQEGLVDAARTLTLARSAELEHATLFEAALEGLDDQRAAGAPVYVCPACGYTTPTLPERCPATGTPKDKFERVD